MRTATEIGCDIWTTDYRELLVRDDIQVIDCSAPNNVHLEIVTAAAETSKHIYCEKPLAMNVAEAQQMVEVAGRAGVKTQS